MRLCLDEHYPPQIAVSLRAAGYDVVGVKERPDLVGAADAELLAAVAAEGRALLTENVQDFAPLARAWTAEGRRHTGIVFASSRALPRSNATIGTYVGALRALLDRYPGHDDLAERIVWLPPAN